MFRSVYAIYDVTAGEVFGPLMLLPNDAVAIRTFRDALFHKDASHREDYDLYWLGSLDTESGAIDAVASRGEAVFGVSSPVITGAALVAAAESSRGGDNGAS